MELHLVNGFLGAGKTTAIIAATKYLMQQGKTVGIVTNDKGQFQVDSAFFHSNQVPTRQVTGGCFRCSFSEFEEEIARLQETAAPDVIFAESVGSCVDLVNTIFSPLQQNELLHIAKTTFSVFADIRLFKRWLHNEPLPFSDQIGYLFSKQIEEGHLLILNKADLYPAEQCEQLLTEATRRFPGRMILLQRSLSPSGVTAWMASLQEAESATPHPNFHVNYAQYKAGEKEMAWLDEEIYFTAETPDITRSGLIDFIHALISALHKQRVMVGHIKLLIGTANGFEKLSFTTSDFIEGQLPLAWQANLPPVHENRLSVMLNARVAIDAQVFDELMEAAIRQARSQSSIDIQLEKGLSYNPDMSMQRL